MTTHKNKNKPLMDEDRDNLEDITDIGEEYARALYEIGICHFADLGKYTPEELSELLLGAGVSVSPKRIKNKDWIGQALNLDPQTSRAQMSFETAVEFERKPKELQCKEVWKPQTGADFSVFFEYKINEQGEKVFDEHGDAIWQVHIYLGETKEIEEKTFKGTDTASWVNWILERTPLPKTARLITKSSEAAPEPASAEKEDEVAMPPEFIKSYDAKVDISKIDVSEVEATPGEAEKRMWVTIHFQLSGADAEQLTIDRIPYQAEVRTVDMDGGIVNYVGSEQIRLKPKVFKYTNKQELPIPNLGHYELQSIVHVLSPSEVWAYRKGPPIKIVP